ncbi:tetratricopeptide repeat protein [Streptomyces sp. Da 82-17]|uniref:tetratricopeptide repeat protein n=1 Tax=Streptomyces sp. Da 82-17 TaxID=3377116 RepID=UPI0038D380AF
MTDQAVDTQVSSPLTETAAPGAVRDPEAPEFVGRQRELKELRADIARTGLDTLSGRKPARARVLLIAGRPGSGRTALAERLADELAGDYPDGVLHARLTEPDGRPVPTERTARALLDALSVPVTPGADEDELTEILREALAVRRVLMLLDGAADAEQVDPLLPDAPQCLVVATSQGPLTGISDVRPCTLGGLDTKSALDLLTAYTGSVRITVDPRAAEHLAEQCGHQPSALVLAGGWLADRPKASVAELAKMLHNLPDDDSTEQGSPGSLARVFRFVYDSLPGPAARILRLLCLAPAGLADPHTASALAGCSVGAAATTLQDFARLGLVRRTGAELAQGPEYAVPGCLQPMLRGLTETQDRPGEVQLARARMLERTVRLLHSCRAVTEPEGSVARGRLAGLPRALRFDSPQAAADWLRLRRPALLASARLAVADGNLDTLARRLMAALTRALVAHCGQDAAADLYGIHRLVLDVAERRDLPREQAAALLNLGDLDAGTGRTREALAHYRAALDAARAAKDPYALGRAMESVGGAYQELGDLQRAADWFGRALSDRLARGERLDAARLYGRIAGTLTYAGRYGDALRNWRSAASGYRKAGEIPAYARALSEMARVQEYAGRPEESLRTCQEAVEWARRAEDVRLQAALQVRLADTLDRLGDSASAGLHRAAAERMLGEELAASGSATGPDGGAGPGAEGSSEDGAG